MASRQRKPKRLDIDPEECVIPPPIAETLLPQLTFGQPPHERRSVRQYIEGEAPDEKIVHLEKVKSESVMGRKVSVWDVRTNKKRWWVITNPTNLYSQELFPSLDYTLTFHIGLMKRMLSRSPASESDSQRRRLIAALTRWEEAAKALEVADEAEEIQSVGMRLRECLIRFIEEMGPAHMVPAGTEAPKQADVNHWSEIIANHIAQGSSSREVRRHLKVLARSAWQLVNWLTHAKGAVRQDGQLALDAVRTVLSSYWHAMERFESGAPDRCPQCGSYRISVEYRDDLGIEPPYVTFCERCGWVSPERMAKFLRKIAEATAAGVDEVNEEPPRHKR